jgi:hypothetical protein
MNRYQNSLKVGVLLGALLLAPASLLYAQNQAAAPMAKSASGTVTFTVTAVGKKDVAPPVAVDDVQLFTGKERKQIADWKKGDKLFLAILIDDSIDSVAAGQWDSLKEFIMAQPPSTYIAVGYIANNSTKVVQDFTDNHELATKALRIPFGLAALGSSPYLGTLDMLKRWPDTGIRRSILLISSGIDTFRGGGMGAFYPDLDGVIMRAERQNTNIWTVYFPSSSHHGRSFYLATYGQNNLNKLADDTGAESYYLGPSTPVSLKPYFDEIGTHLSNQYLLTFAGSGGTKGKYQSVKVKTETKDLEFFTPAAVYLPGTK